MKFLEIKDKIQNLGNLKSLLEIKKAGLRICRNTKTGDYWLIEEEFLKPVIKSPMECKSINIKLSDLRNKILMCHKSPDELQKTKIIDYIAWGEKQKTDEGVSWDKVPSVTGRKNWYELIETNEDVIIPRTVNQRYICFSGKVDYSDRFYGISNKEVLTFLNSSIFMLLAESLSKQSLGLGALDLNIIEIVKIPVLEFKKTFNYEVRDVFLEFKIDPSQPTRSQQPNPLSDRKALDDIVFDALALTKQERKEVYWAVCELVKNRLEKARNV